MSRFMRDELAEHSNAHSIFSLLASRAMEARLPEPVPLPPVLNPSAADSDDVYDAVGNFLADGRWVVDLKRFGVSIRASAPPLHRRPSASRAYARGRPFRTPF